MSSPIIGSAENRAISRFLRQTLQQHAGAFKATCHVWSALVESRSLSNEFKKVHLGFAEMMVILPSIVTTVVG